MLRLGSILTPAISLRPVRNHKPPEQTTSTAHGMYSSVSDDPLWLTVFGSDAQHMQCYGWSAAVRSLRLPTLRNTFTPNPARTASRFAFPTRQTIHLRQFGSAVLADAQGGAAKHSETEPSPKLSPAALARAASQTIRLCGKEKQFGDALYILNSIRFSNFPPTPTPKARHSQLLSSVPSSINGYTFIEFGQPVPTRLASHSFLHSLVKAGLPTKAATQAKLMLAEGIRIRTKTMESILASTVDKSPYPPAKPLNPPRGKVRLDGICKYPIASAHTRIAVRLLEEARRRRQERTQRMYDIVIKACLLQGEIIVASLLFVMVIKDWQLRQALKKQLTDNPPPESSGPLNASPLYPTRQTYWSLLERIEHTLTTQKDPKDPSFRNAIQALANLAFAVDTGQFPPRLMGSLIKALYSVPKSGAVVYLGSPNEVYTANAYTYIHQVLMRLVCDAGERPDAQRNPAARQNFNLHALNALLHYCLHHPLPKAHAFDLLDIMKRKWGGIPASSANLLLRTSTLLRDDTIRMDGSPSAHTTDTAPISSHSVRRVVPVLPLTRWAHIVNILKLELAIRYPSEPVMHTPATPDPYTVTSLIAHLTATSRSHIIAERLVDIIPELNPVGEGGSGIPLRERGRHAVSYGPYFFAAVLNALVKSGRAFCAEWVWRLAVEAEKASWTGENEPWFLPIHAYTCILRLYSGGGKVTASLGSGGNHGVGGRKRRVANAMATGKQIFREVRLRCRFLEDAKGRNDDLGWIPPTLRNFAPDARYFNALLDLYGRRVVGYARPRTNHRSYWRWLERIIGERFARSGATAVHWHPILAEIVTEMCRYGYKVPAGLKFLLVGRTSGVETGDSKTLQPVRPRPLPPPRKHPRRIPVFKTRGLPVPRGGPRRRIRRGV